MLQQIRERAQGIIAWIIVAIIAFVFCFWGISGYFASNSSDVVAKVGNRKITSNEINDIYNRWLRANSMQKDFDPSSINPTVIKQQITQAVARQIALINSMGKSGMAISDSVVVDNIKSNPQLQENGKFSMQLYHQALASMGVDESTFESLQRDELMLNQLQLAVLASSFVLKSDVERYIALKNQQRSFGYAVVPVSKFLANATVSDQEISDFYEKHKAQFVTQDQVSLEYIELSLDDLLKHVTVNDQKLQDYYKQNVADFTQPATYRLRHIAIAAPAASDADKGGEAQEKIDDIYRQLKSGADFQQLAKTASDDKLTGADGGDLGWVRKDDPTIPAAAFALSKVGEYTKPVRSDYGWHIFQLADIKPGSVQSFASVKKILQDRYKHDEAQKLFTAKGEELANLTFENPNSLSAASEKLGLPIQTTGYFSSTGGSGIAQSPNVLRAAFSDDVYNAMHNSSLIRISDDTYVVIHVKDKKPAKQSTLEEVRAEIVSHLKTVAASEKAKEQGEALLAQVKEGNSPNKTMASQRLQWRTVTNITRESKDVDSSILQRAFSIAVKGQSTAPAIGFSLPNGDYAVVALSKVTDGKLPNSDDDHMIEMYSKQLTLLNGRYEFASLQDALIEQTKIKFIGN